MSARILVLEDDESLKRVLSRALSVAGFQVRATASPETAISWVREDQGDLLLADVMLEGTNFLDQLSLVTRMRPELPVIIMSANATASTAIDAEKGGAFEYLPKPFDLDDLVTHIRTAVGKKPKVRASGGASEPTGFIGQSAAIQTTFKSIARAASSGAHVVFTGESGVGKRQAAEALLKACGLVIRETRVITPSHSAEETFESTQSGKPVLWLRVNEWDAVQQRAARDALDSGTSRVIATMTPGEGHPIDPNLMVRLSEYIIDVPPLRERREDIAALAEAFLRMFSRRDGRDTVVLAPEALESLRQAPWAGNVAELRSVLSRLMLSTRGTIASRAEALAALQNLNTETVADLPGAARQLAGMALQSEEARQVALDALDRALFEQALGRVGGNRSKAAELLGVNRNTLARRLQELGDGSEEE